MDEDVGGAGDVEGVASQAGEGVFAYFVGEQAVGGEALVDDPAGVAGGAEAVVEQVGEAVVGVVCGAGAFEPGVPEGDDDGGAGGCEDVGAADEVAGGEFFEAFGAVEGGCGEGVAGDGVAGAQGDGGVGARAGVVGQPEGEGEFVAGVRGVFDGVGDEVFAGGDGEFFGAGDAQGGVAAGVDAASLGASGEAGAADVEGFLAVAVAEVDAQGAAAAVEADDLAERLGFEGAEFEEVDALVGADDGGAEGCGPGGRGVCGHGRLNRSDGVGISRSGFFLTGIFGGARALGGGQFRPWTVNLRVLWSWCCATWGPRVRCGRSSGRSATTTVRI